MRTSVGNLYRKIWDRLSVTDRKAVLVHAGVWEDPSMVDHESKLKWNKLLPSTQEKLIGQDFSMILGKEVSPETE
jgi:hypothetical protein